MQIDVWLACLELDAARLASCWAVLSADEQARANRFYFERDRRHCVAARGLLRQLLAQYTGLEAARVRFEYGPSGKPALAAGQADGVQFNISHSHGRAVFAFCRERAVGVDIERVRQDVDWQTLARQFFSAREIELLQAVAPAEQCRAFFRCWTRKEAYLKARGDGLAVPLDGFTVSVDAERPALLDIADDQVSRWRLATLDAGADYEAALAVECPCNEQVRIIEKEWAACAFS